jgi:hypothetical protein
MRGLTPGRRFIRGRAIVIAAVVAAAAMTAAAPSAGAAVRSVATHAVATHAVAAHAAGHRAGAARGISPDVNNLLFDNGAFAFQCNAGQEYVLSGTENFFNYTNNCEFRTFIYQHPDHQGWSFCMNPHSSGTVPSDRRNPEQVRIGTSIGEHC